MMMVRIMIILRMLMINISVVRTTLIEVPVAPEATIIILTIMMTMKTIVITALVVIIL